MTVPIMAAARMLLIMTIVATMYSVPRPPSSGILLNVRFWLRVSVASRTTRSRRSRTNCCATSCSNGVFSRHDILLTPLHRDEVHCTGAGAAGSARWNWCRRLKVGGCTGEDRWRARQPSSQRRRRCAAIPGQNRTRRRPRHRSATSVAGLAVHSSRPARRPLPVGPQQRPHRLSRHR